MKAPKLVKCPTCRKEGRWFEAAYGPFCSHRCKLIDLGKWLGEEHAISEPLPSDPLLRQPSQDSRSPGNQPDLEEDEN